MTGAAVRRWIVTSTAAHPGLGPDYRATRAVPSNHLSRTRRRWRWDLRRQMRRWPRPATCEASSSSRKHDSCTNGINDDLTYRLTSSGREGSLPRWSRGRGRRDATSVSEPVAADGVGQAGQVLAVDTQVYSNTRPGVPSASADLRHGAARQGLEGKPEPRGDRPDRDGAPHHLRAQSRSRTGT
jgi:hypothetical protein